MAEITNEKLAGALAQAAALSLVVGATLAVINQAIPDFKARALAALRNAAVSTPEKFATAEAQAIAGMAATILNDLDDV